jgi:hypothetical protein
VRYLSERSVDERRQSEKSYSVGGARGDYLMRRRYDKRRHSWLKSGLGCSTYGRMVRRCNVNGVEPTSSGHRGLGVDKKIGRGAF